MLKKPWLITLGPWPSYPTAARDELNAIATGLEPLEFVDKIWVLRDGSKRVRSRNKGWPKTTRIRGSGYKILTKPDKVLRLPTRLRAVSGTGKPAPQGNQQDP